MSQFTNENGKLSLKDFFDVPHDVYPVGRLDYDSEGLLILTNDKSLNQRLLHPSHAHERTYWVQVEGAVTPDQLLPLEKGITISINGKPHHTLPARVGLLNDTSSIAERNPPIRYRKDIPDSWISLTLREGKNRQVRRMTAAIGFPTLRLIRYSIEGLTIDNLPPGTMRSLTKSEIYHRLFH